MSAAKRIKKQKKIKSKHVTPEKDAKDLDALKEKDLEGIAGGRAPLSSYSDWAKR
jgi:hypothetical protein